MRERTELFDGTDTRFLHVAPEPALGSRLRRAVGAGYLSADLYDPSAMIRVDITAMDFPENSFDAIYCSHVLEHVTEDRRAMQEFRRVLSPTGWAILNVPITAEETIEDPSVTDPKERLRLWGQEDHVRRYGPDYIDRLGEAGFIVDMITVEDLVTPEEAERMGLTAGSGEIYFCRV